MCWEDCVLMSFCPCCAVNQLYQTTAYLRKPATNVGSRFNTNIMAENDKQFTFMNTLYMFCCAPCNMGDALNRAMGMPWFLGCCCTPVCSARNVLRYHHRVHTTLHEESAILWTAGYCNAELFEECCLPTLFYTTVGLLDQCTYGLADLLWCGANTYFVAQIVAESQTGRAGPGYLVGYRQNIAATVTLPVAREYVPPNVEYVSPMIVKSSTVVDRGDEVELRFN